MRLRSREILRALLVCAMLVGLGFLARHLESVSIEGMFATART